MQPPRPSQKVLTQHAGRGAIRPANPMKRPVLVAFFALILMATLAVEPHAAQVSPDATIPLPASNDYAANILAGISNQGRTKQHPYVTAGDRTYLIGTQDGNFPDMGTQTPGT